MEFRFSVAAFTLGLVACSQSAGLPTAREFKLDVVVTPANTPPADALNFTAHLAGENEVPPRATRAQGQAILHLSADGSTMEFRLLVADISNVIASHIHIAPAGVNGQIVVFLFGPAAPGGGRVDGVLATGTFTAADFIGPLAGHPMSDLLAAIQAGNAYVNVHTNDGIAPTNTGPGDFPGGEIRNQIGGGHVGH